MIGLVTELARAQQAELEKQQREVGRAPLHAMAEGAEEYREENPTRAELLADPDDEAEKVDALPRHSLRHPDSGQFVPAPKHPYLTDGHARDSLGNQPATPRTDPAPTFPVPVITPSPDVVVQQVFTATPGTDSASAVVQHLSFASPPVPVSTRPAQAPFHSAPTGSPSV